MSPEEIQINNLKKHQFDDWAKGLMEQIPVLDPWQIAQVGENNQGPYRDGYRKISIKDNQEPLVNCADFGLMSKDYYLGKLIDGFLTQDESFLPAFKQRLMYPFAWLRKSVTERLQKADQILRNHGLFLVINSGWRHPDIQTLAAELIKNQFGEKEATIRLAKVHQDVYQSPPPHATGGAIDIELWSMTLKAPLSFSYPGDVISSFALEQKRNLTEIEKSKCQVRRILFHLLTTPSVCFSPEEVFTWHPGEFWHYGDGDPLSAYLNQESEAKYGYIEPPADYQVCPY